MKMWKLDGYVNKITYAEYNPASRGEWFETWVVAHHVLMRRADERLERARVELSRARTSYKKVLHMKESQT